MFNPKATPREDQGRPEVAGVQVPHPGPGASSTTSGPRRPTRPVGLPEPDLYGTARAGAKDQRAADKQFANVPAENYSPRRGDQATCRSSSSRRTRSRSTRCSTGRCRRCSPGRTPNIDQLLADAETKVNNDPGQLELTTGGAGRPAGAPRAARPYHHIHRRPRSRRRDRGAARRAPAPRTSRPTAFLCGGAALLRVLLLVPDGPGGHARASSRQLRGPSPSGSGWTTSRTVFDDPAVRTAWRNTVMFTGLALIFGFAVPFVVAIVLNELRHAQGFFRFVVYLPVMLPPVVSVLLWQVVLRPRHRPVQPGAAASCTCPASQLARRRRHRADLAGHRLHLGEHGQRRR